nr:MAG TPA: hypothetical protein [Caudoviricetes sp.]
MYKSCKLCFSLLRSSLYSCSNIPHRFPNFFFI